MSPSARKMRSTMRRLPRITTTPMSAAAPTTATGSGTPSRPSPPATPANSASVVPPLAMSTTTAANSVQRTPKRSRIRSIRPLPVTVPRRATISWVMISATRMGRNAQSRWLPYLAPVLL